MTTDEQNTARAVIEGHAEYVERAYEQRFLGGVTPDTRWKYTNLSGSYSAGVYFFGAKYFAAKSDSVSDSWAVAADPPSTTEQILHPNTSVGGPKPLSVTTGKSAKITSRDTLGELAIRNALRSRLRGETAKDAASGWGNDSVIQIQTQSREQGTIWVTRWDSETDASEFSEAIRAYRSTLSDDQRQNFRVNRNAEIVIVEIQSPDSLSVAVTAPGEIQIESG